MSWSMAGVLRADIRPRIACDPGVETRCVKSCASAERRNLRANQGTSAKGCIDFAFGKCQDGRITGILKDCISGVTLNRKIVTTSGARRTRVRTVRTGRFMFSHLPGGRYDVMALQGSKVKLASCISVRKRMTANLGTICLCPAGSTQCSSICADLRNDANNCGSCGNICPAGSPCIEGVCTPGQAGLNVQVLTNDVLAPIVGGPTVPAGTPITVTYIVQNIGAVEVNNITINNNQNITINCPKTTLKALESMTCIATIIAGAGENANTAVVTGSASDGKPVHCRDTGHYTGVRRTPVPSATRTVSISGTKSPTVPVPTASPSQSPTARPSSTPTSVAIFTPTSTSTPGGPSLTPTPIPTSPGGTPGENSLVSPAFKFGEMLPVKYMAMKCGGENLSVPLEWNLNKKGTKSYAVIQSGNIDGSSWGIFNIPAEENSLPEGIPGVRNLPDGSVQTTNYDGTVGYRGPCPPFPDETHYYSFLIYALQDTLDPAGITTVGDLASALSMHVPTAYLSAQATWTENNEPTPTLAATAEATLNPE